MGIQDVIRFFLPKEDHFYDFLEQQADVAKRAAQLAESYAEGNVPLTDACAQLRELEHDGDKLEHGMEEALGLTFVTPIDREDLQRLSSELDTVLDATNRAVQSCNMLGVTKPTEPMKKLATLIVKSTAKVNEAVPLLRKHQYSRIVELARELRKLEKEGDTVFREAIRDLFSEAVGGGPAHLGANDARVLVREKTVLEDLENAVDACDQIADTLSNLAIKHG